MGSEIKMSRNMELNRRRFLRGMGVGIALPFMESVPTVAGAAGVAGVAAGGASGGGPNAKAVVCIGVALGMYPEAWVPKGSGRDYKLSKLLEPVGHLRDDFTVVSGAEHPGVSGGHRGFPAFLSGRYRPERVGSSVVVRNTVTVDQFAAKAIGQTTRFESLKLAATPQGGQQAISWNEYGVPLRVEGRPEVLFRQLFVDDADKGQADRRLRAGQSVLDFVMEDTRVLAGEISTHDRHRLDEYMTAIRGVEKRIERQKMWVNTPKPRVDAQEVRPTTFHENLSVIYELMALAIETDSTRVISLNVTQMGLPIEAGGQRFGSGYHGQSHHGKDPTLVSELVAIETEHMRALGGFLDRLKKTKQGGASLLDGTQVLFGSGLGNASSHSNRDLPILLAGGGMKHGQHLVRDQGTPLCDLYVTMLQGLGIEADAFATSQGNFNNELL